MNNFDHTPQKVEITGINEIFGDQFMDRFQVYKNKSGTLFDPSKEELINYLSKKLCPYCGRRLYMDRTGLIWRCKSKKSKDKFIIRSETLNKYK